MPNEAIAYAIKSVLGDYASPEKIAEIDAALVSALATLAIYTGFTR